MKVREVIELYHWVEGSGFSHNEIIENNIIDIEDLNVEMNWDWWETDGVIEGKDIKILVTYYDVEDEYLENPLKTYIAWESDLIENGLYDVEVYDDYNQ